MEDAPAADVPESAGDGDAATPGDAPGPQRVRSRRQSAASSGRGTDVWHEIESTPDFWDMLDPIDPSVIPRIQELAIRHRWEIFFITQRPATAGDTVQRQTQRWLARHGFEMPSVMVLNRSRGRLAEALNLDYLVDDSAKNCVDVISESQTKALLVLGHDDLEASKPTKAKSLGIGVMPSAAACLDLFEEIQTIRANTGLLEKLARMVGWSRG